MPVRQRLPRVKDGAKLRWIRTLCCLVCGDNTSVEAAHVNYGHLGRPRGKGEKASDAWVLPLCSKCHHAQTNYPWGERRYWEFKNVNARGAAAELDVVHRWYDGDPEMAEGVLTTYSRLMT